MKSTLAGASLPNQAELRDDLVAWLRRARAAGLAPEDVTALFETTMRATATPPALEAKPA